MENASAPEQPDREESFMYIARCLLDLCNKGTLDLSPAAIRQAQPQDRLPLEDPYGHVIIEPIRADGPSNTILGRQLRVSYPRSGGDVFKMVFNPDGNLRTVYFHDWIIEQRSLAGLMDAGYSFETENSSFHLIDVRGKDPKGILEKLATAENLVK
jgi:hypothetical protein